MGVRINNSNVSIECIRGVVTLDGTVVTMDEPKLAESIARAVAGVTDVVNRIVVSKETERSIGQGVENTISPSGPREP